MICAVHSILRYVDRIYAIKDVDGSASYDIDNENASTLCVNTFCALILQSRYGIYGISSVL